MGNTKTNKSAQSKGSAAQSRKRRKKRNRHTFGKFLAIIQIILSVVFMAVLLMLNILPTKYLVLIFGLLAFLDAETNEEKLDVLQVIRKDMTEKIMSSIEASMDLCFVEATLEDRIERAIDMLRTKIRYEGTRMR